MPTLDDDLAMNVDLPRGTRLQEGRFILGRVLGRGGFGITYHAQSSPAAAGVQQRDDAPAEKVVAIKEFFPQGCTRCGLNVQFPDAGQNTSSDREKEQAHQNFLNEARVLAALNHPGIVRVEAAFQENHTAYMVMEFLEGDTLQDIIHKSGPLAENVAVDYIEQIGAALDEVHQAHFIHRDIKADNIMIGASGPRQSQLKYGRVVLLDFGLNKEIGANNTYHTLRLTNALRFGSPGYSPPEQYGRQARFGPYTDIYALGATLYYLLSGQLPPEAPERMSGIDMVPPHELFPRIRRPISDAVTWALELKGDARPQSVREFLNALRDDSSSPLYSGHASRNAANINSAPKPAGPLSSRIQSQTSSQSNPAQVNPAQVNPAQSARAAIPPSAPFSRRGFPAQQGTVAHQLNPAQAGIGGKIGVFAARSGAGFLRFLWLNVVEVLPRLLLIVAIIAALMYSARNQQPEEADKKKVKQNKREKMRRQKQQKPDAT